MDNLTLMERLKESTRAMHDSAESSPFQGHLANGRLPVDTYADYLEQLYLIHGYLEQEIGRHSKAGANFAGVMTDEQLQQPFLQVDLEHFGRSVKNIKPIAATKKLFQHMEELSRDCPVALLGMHYVLLGSKHGGKFVSKTCQEKYNLPNKNGVLYFDPYDQTFMPLWKAFKEKMNTLQLNQVEIEKSSEAAAAMFNAIGEIGAELLQTPASTKS